MLGAFMVYCLYVAPLENPLPYTAGLGFSTAGLGFSSSSLFLLGLQGFSESLQSDMQCCTDQLDLQQHRVRGPCCLRHGLSVWQPEARAPGA